MCGISPPHFWFSLFSWTCKKKAWKNIIKNSPVKAEWGGALHDEPNNGCEWDYMGWRTWEKKKEILPFVTWSIFYLQSGHIESQKDSHETLG